MNSHVILAAGDLALTAPEVPTGLRSTRSRSRECQCRSS